MHNHQITLYSTNEDQAFRTLAPSGMTQGDGQEPAQRNLCDAMHIWADLSQELGQPFPQPNGERLVLANKRQQPKQALL